MCRAPGSDRSRHGRGSCSRSCGSHGRSLRRPPPMRRRRSRPPPRAVAAVALERQYTVSAPVADRLRNPLSAAHGGDGHDAAMGTSISSSAGMAVLALDWSSTRHGPRTRRAASAQALTGCRCGTPRRTHDRAKSNIPEHCSKPRRATFRALRHQAVAAIRATVGSVPANKRGGYAAGT